ncbi:MAG TPA: hypothetical protein VHQ42_08525 [Candidatus Limnocylindria bacterium]|nr:hypothetical protein [Candidatus Limnocylindria bacterium]
MTRRLAIISCLLVALLTACRGVTPGAPPDSGPPGLASRSAAPASEAASLAPSATQPEACALGTAVAEYAYPGLREFVNEFRGISRGVAVAEVVSVGEVQYSTESGQRPSCDEIQAAGSGFSIGRLVDVRVITPVGGAVEKDQVLTYLYQGGSLGKDSSPGHPFGLAVPRAGDLMLVLISREPIDADPGAGELPVEVLEMFLVTQGRVVTPDPAERVPVQQVGDVLRDVLPSASPSN